MARRYLDVESLDGAVVRCEVLEWRASRYVGAYFRDGARHHAVVLRPDTGALVLVVLTGRDSSMISGYDPHENRHEWDWPILAERLERHTNRSK